MEHKGIKRVLNIGMYDTLGGIETFIMNYYRNIDKTKIQYDFINMYDKLCFEDELIELGANVYKVTNVKKNPIKNYLDIKKVIKDQEYDTVHIHMLSAANVVPLIAAKTSKVEKIIAHSHNSGVPKGVLKRMLNSLNKKIVRKCANVFFACSDKAGEWMFTKKAKYVVINNAIEIERFQFNEQVREDFRKKYNLTDELVIGHVGRFAEQKNHHFIIDMFHKLTINQNNVKLFLVGDGELKEEIIKKAQNLEISDKIIFELPTLEVNKLYNVFDLFILPSLFEGLGIVLIEAQVNGLPCVVSDYIQREAIINNNVKSISLSDIDAWIHEIKEILSKDNNRTISNETIEKSGFDIKREANKLLEYYL